jgi:SAM-dependent methyltransferase
MADYYDEIYARLVDYRSQIAFLERIFKKFQKGKVKSILDVACGTGNFTLLFAKRGYKAAGIDLSRDMIRVAKGKRETKETKTEFFQMDMRDIRLKETFDATTVLFGGFGYLLSHEDVKRFLRSVKARLNKNGLLLFEFWHVSGVLPEASSESGYLSWDRAKVDGKLIIRLNENKYDPRENICRMSFEFYVLDTKARILLDSFSETHRLKVYSISEIANLLEQNGFRALGFFESLHASGKMEPAKQSSFRILCVASLKSVG